MLQRKKSNGKISHDYQTSSVIYTSRGGISRITETGSDSFTSFDMAFCGHSRVSRLNIRTPFEWNLKTNIALSTRPKNRPRNKAWIKCFDLCPPVPVDNRQLTNIYALSTISTHQVASYENGKKATIFFADMISILYDVPKWGISQCFCPSTLIRPTTKIRLNRDIFSSLWLGHPQSFVLIVAPHRDVRWVDYLG